MNREEFMRQLEVLLIGITSSEKEEALQYYTDYFEDAGVENEASVIAALGTPAKVAETIKADFCGKTQEDLEFTETGVKDHIDRNNEVIVRKEEKQQNNGYQGYEKQNSYESDRNQLQSRKSNSKIIWIVIIAILTSPIWLGLAGSLFGAVVAVLAALAGFLLAFGIVAIALIVAGVVVFAFSIMEFFMAPLAGILLMGISLLLVGFGILFTLGSIWVFGTVIPACIRGIVRLCRIPFHKKGGQYA